MKYTVLYVEHRFPIPPGMRESKMVSRDRCGQPVGRSYESQDSTWLESTEDHLCRIGGDHGNA